MKKVLIFLMVFTSGTVLAQNGFGVKGGLNYGDNGEIEFADAMNAVENTESKIGYHLGIFYRVGVAGFLLKPELLYTRTESSYKLSNGNADYNISKLDLPILVGTRLIGPVNVFAGPSLQYILENEFQDLSLDDLEKEFTIGAQLGAGVQLGSVGVDVRYERGLTKNEAEVLNLDNPQGIRRVDSRANQFIVSLSINL